MAKLGTIPTTQYIRDLAEKAESGDQDAYKELGDLNNRLAKRANERMRYMERKGMEGTGAYKIAKYNIQTTAQDTGKTDYFSQSRKLDPGQLMDNLTNVSTFLESQTSTVRGEEKRREKIVDTLVDRGYIDPDIAETPKFKKKFLEFLSSEGWEGIKRNIGTAREVLNGAAEAIRNGAKLSDLSRAFRDYQRQTDLNTDMFEIWDNWKSAKTYYRAGSWQELKRSRKRLL